MHIEYIAHMFFEIHPIPFPFSSPTWEIVLTNMIIDNNWYYTIMNDNVPRTLTISELVKRSHAKRILLHNTWRNRQVHTDANSCWIKLRSGRAMLVLWWWSYRKYIMILALIWVIFILNSFVVKTNLLSSNWMKENIYRKVIQRWRYNNYNGTYLQIEVDCWDRVKDIWFMHRATIIVMCG